MNKYRVGVAYNDKNSNLIMHSYEFVRGDSFSVHEGNLYIYRLEEGIRTTVKVFSQRCWLSIEN